MKNDLLEVVSSERARKTFYPTPRAVAEKLLETVDMRPVKYILEPSAGKGDLVTLTVGIKHMMGRRPYARLGIPADYPETDAEWKDAWSGLFVDCIEIDPLLRQQLEALDYRVIHDDFLTFETQMRYDLIVMNPPFDQGADHLLKAIDIMRRGGQIACILNAETLRNPYSYKRDELLKLLDKYDANVRYVEGAFRDAERSTDVDVALITMSIPAVEIDSTIMDDMRRAPTYKTMNAPPGVSEMVQYNAIQEWVNRYDFEVGCGIRMLEEYEAVKFTTDKGKFEKPLLSLKISGKTDEPSINEYIRETRRKYWNRLFMQPVITEKFTSNILNELRDNVNKLADYEFSAYNILTLIIKFNARAIKGVEDTIIALFDKWTASYWHEDGPNRHYFDGWCTNDCFRINKKVIVSFRAFSYYSWSDTFEDYRVREYLEDIEKTLDYLDSGNTTCAHDLKEVLQRAKEDKQYKNIDTKYFLCTFYKKGTAHLVFKDMDLLEKFNMYACQKKGWLPPDYGKKRYHDMSKESQHIVDSFQGKKKYEEVMARADYFLNAGGGQQLLLGGSI